MKVCWIAKRHYTNKDALRERYGRVYRLPLAWAGCGVAAALELVDYHGHAPEALSEGALRVASTPAWHPVELRAMARRVEASQPGVIVASGDCFLGMVALRLARKTGARLVFDVYDDYRKFGAYRAFLGWDAYGFLVQRADLVFYASEALAREHPHGGAPWRLVPNGIDPEAFRPAERAGARRRADLADNGSVWVGYFGSMEPERGATDLVAAVGSLHAENPKVRLILCGNAHPDVDLDRPWVDYRGNVPHARVADFINACDIVALPYRRGPIIDMASSVKIAEYLACARPVVATATPNLLSNFPTQARELGQALCRPGDPADLARAIDFQLSRRIVATFPAEHSWERIADDALAALSDLVA